MNEQQTSEPTAPETTSRFLDLSSATFDVGYKSCQQTAKQLFGPFLWMISNTTGNERKSLHAVISHLTRVSNFLDIHTEEGICTEAWENYREEVSVCLLYTSPSPRDATLSRMPSSA